jgi:hypothetical protein
LEKKSTAIAPHISETFSQVTSGEGNYCVTELLWQNRKQEKSEARELRDILPVCLGGS